MPSRQGIGQMKVSISTCLSLLNQLLLCHFFQDKDLIQRYRNWCNEAGELNPEKRPHWTALHPFQRNSVNQDDGMGCHAPRGFYTRFPSKWSSDFSGGAPSFGLEPAESLNMQNVKFSNIATHTDPAWGKQSNWMLHADLEKDGLPERGEQIWAKQFDRNNFQICCIPFFTRGIALGDIIEADAENIILRVTERNGHRNLRAAMTLLKPQVHNQLHDWVERTGLLYEWFEGKYLATDLPPGAALDSLDMKFLERMAEDQKIVFETDG